VKREILNHMKCTNAYRMDILIWPQDVDTIKIWIECCGELKHVLVYIISSVFFFIYIYILHLHLTNVFVLSTCKLKKKIAYMTLQYKHNLYTLSPRNIKKNSPRSSLFFLFLKLIQIILIFYDNVSIYMSYK